MKSDPFVLCLTNTVAANFTANVLLAIGAKPAMIEEPSEAAELAAVADAVLVNVGTLTPAQAEVMRAAVAVLAGPVPTDSAGSIRRGLSPRTRGLSPGCSTRWGFSSCPIVGNSCWNLFSKNRRLFAEITRKSSFWRGLSPI